MISRVVVLLLAGFLLGGCSVQVSGMQNPAARDWGELEWMPVNVVLDQPFVVGSGHSAAIHNDALTTPAEFIERLAELPDDATSGELLELRIPLRLWSGEEGPWETGTRIQLLPATVDLEPGEPIFDEVIDLLPRTYQRVILSDLPSGLQAGDVVVIRLIPGNGPQAGRLETGVTPHRAPFGGWRLYRDGEMAVGSMAFEARYMRDVDSRGIAREAVDRMGTGGTGFLALWGVLSLSVAAGVVVIGRAGVSNGR